MSYNALKKSGTALALAFAVVGSGACASASSGTPSNDPEVVDISLDREWQQMKHACDGRMAYSGDSLDCLNALYDALGEWEMLMAPVEHISRYAGQSPECQDAVYALNEWKTNVSHMGHGQSIKGDPYVGVPMTRTFASLGECFDQYVNEMTREGSFDRLRQAARKRAGEMKGLANRLPRKLDLNREF